MDAYTFGTSTGGRVGQITGPGGKCVDVNGGNTADGTKIQFWTCTGGTNQRWPCPEPQKTGAHP